MMNRKFNVLDNLLFCFCYMEINVPLKIGDKNYSSDVDRFFRRFVMLSRIT